MKGKIKTWHIALISFMALFIAILTSMLSLKATTPTSTDEEESTVDNWELGIVFYDTTIGNGKTPLTEYNWNAISYKESRDIILQITYRNNSVKTTYEPDELKITVPIPQYYNSEYVPIYSVTAGELSEGNNWNYTTLTINNQKYLVLQNNINIETGINFEGSVQIAFRPNPELLSNNYIFYFNAILTNNNEKLAQTNEIPFSFTSNKRNNVITKTPEKIKAYDGLPENANDYIWIKWKLIFGSAGEGVRAIEMNTSAKYTHRDKNPNAEVANSLHFIEYVPSNAIVVDYDGTILENNNGVVDFKVSTTDWDWQQQYSSLRYIFIGYPKDEFSDQKITNKIEAYGIYWDETEESLLASYETTVNSANYSFDPTGTTDGFSISKYRTYDSYLVATKAQTSYSTIGYHFDIYTRYYGETMDIEIVDDIMIAPNINNDYTFLSDDEYSFSYINWPGKNLININEQKSQPYKMELWIRYKNTNEYILYNNNLISNVNYVKHGYSDTTIKLPENTVGWKLIIKDVKESLTFIKNSSPATVYVDIFKKDIADSGQIYNFNYLQVYIDGIPQIETSENYYSTNMTQEDIMNYDLEKYNKYLLRAVGSVPIISSRISFFVEEQALNSGVMTSNNETEKFNGKYSIRSTVRTDSIIEEFTGYYYYDLLPEGMEYENLKLSSCNLNAKTASGIQITKEYYENHSILEIIENWKNTNRTLIKIKVDFSDDLVSFVTDDIFYLAYELDVSVSFDSYLEYGAKYTNEIYLEPMDTSGEDFVVTDVYYRPETSNWPKDILDLNENGKNETFVSKGQATLNIINLVASHQDVQTQVQSDVSNFSTGIVDAPSDSIYTYKLRVRTGNSSTTNFTIYCNIENASKRPQWKGTFQGIDTTYASKSYTIKVYYSESNSAGSLTTDTSWKEYDESTVDKSKVKSLAFQYLDSEGNPAVLPSGAYTYVLIKMKAPIEEHITLAYNRCWTEWNAIDEFNRPVDYITGIKSNIVKVALPSSVKDMWKTIVNIHFNKAITGEEADFENMKLDKSDTFKFQITLTNQETGDIVTGILDSKNGLTFGLLPVGTYIVTESDDNYFDFIEMVNGNDPEIIIEGITFEKVGNDYILTILEDVEEDISFQINVTNEIEDERFYEEKHNKENLFLINNPNSSGNESEEH